jgi:hypothetical protein
MLLNQETGVLSTVVQVSNRIRLEKDGEDEQWNQESAREKNEERGGIRRNKGIGLSSDKRSGPRNCTSRNFHLLSQRSHFFLDVGVGCRWKQFGPSRHPK